MKISYHDTDKRFFFEIDLEELRQDAKLKVIAIVKADLSFKIEYLNGHRFILTSEKQHEVGRLVKQELKRLKAI